MNPNLIQRELDDLRLRAAAGSIALGAATARIRALERRLSELS